MSRRNRAGESSLELLLDTICNTFGGVLFLAILVCVMLRATGHSENAAVTEASVSEAEVLRLVHRQKELQAELTNLRTAAAQMDQAMHEFAKPEAVPLLNELRAVEGARDSLEKDRLQSLANIAARQAKVAALVKELAELDARLAAARNKAAQADTALESEIGTHSTSGQPPRERSSGKPQVDFVVRHGRLYQWCRYDAAGQAQGLNTDEFVVVSDGADGVETAPKPHAGLPLNTTSAKEVVARRMRRFDKQRVCFVIAVWEDSFDVFQKVKGAAVELGFEYRLIMMRSGAALSDRGGNDTHVQ